MVPEANYGIMKAKMAEVKQLFQTRHYVQCAALCERLTRGHAEIHPVHMAYLHFYMALSHDTMAREATWKHRPAELDLAEQHYLAALEALSDPTPQKLDDVPKHSPTSPASEDDLAVKGRRISDASQQSIASSATSIADEDMQTTPTKSPAYLKARALFESMPDRPSTPPKSPTRSSSRQIPKPAKRRPAPIITPNAAHSYHEERFSANLSCFIDMIKTHLANVLELKEATVAPTVRFSFARSRSSTVNPRPISRNSSSLHESDMKGMWPSRRTMKFRPRFDPSSVRQLCNEALSEL